MATAPSSPAWSTRRISAIRAWRAPAPGRGGTGRALATGRLSTAGPHRPDEAPAGELERDQRVPAGHGQAEEPPGRLVAVRGGDLGAVHQRRQARGARPAADAGTGLGARPPLPFRTRVPDRDAEADKEDRRQQGAE